MLTIAVCDDEALACVNIKNHVQDILLKKGVRHTINTFFSGQELLSSANNFDIIFLDIKMHLLNGIETAEILRTNGCHSILIFVTSAPKYIHKAFDVEAFHYLLKPIDTVKLEQILERAIQKVTSAQEEYLLITSGRQVLKLSIAELTFLEVTGRIIKAHTLEHTYEFYEQLSNLEQKLPSDTFLRCHKSYLVNLHFIKLFNKTEIFLDNGERLPLSRHRYDKFSKAFLAFLKKEGVGF